MIGEQISIFEAESGDVFKVESGDVFELGEHRLMCGDATNRDDVLTLMGGEKANLVFTDPPYGLKKEKDGVTNDNLNQSDLLEFNKKWIPLSFEVLNRPGSWYCWGTDEVLMDIYSQILKPMKRRQGDEKLTFRNLITWDKGALQGMLSDDLRMYPPNEKCLFVMTGRQTYGQTKADYWEGFEPFRMYFKEQKDKTGLSISKLIELFGVSTITHWWAVSQWEFPNRDTYLNGMQNVLEHLYPEDSDRVREEYDRVREEYDRVREEYDRVREEYDRVREEFYASRAYFDNTWKAMTDVWRYAPVANGSAERADTEGFPTVKPIALCQQAIITSTRPGDLVLDLFGGSGSTLIACEGVGRRANMMEIDPKWCSVIIRRWEKHTGKKAVRKT